MSLNEEGVSELHGDSSADALDPSKAASWAVTPDTRSRCRYVTRVNGPASMTECRVKCSRDGMNVFTARIKGGSLRNCYCRRCSPSQADGRLASKQPDGGGRYETHVLVRGSSTSSTTAATASSTSGSPTAAVTTSSTSSPPGTTGSGAATSTPAGGAALPRTVFWDANNLVAVRALLAEPRPPPAWAATALRHLVQAAEERMSFPPGRSVSRRGPWSPAMKSSTPPSGDKRDFYSTSIYAWPCDVSCSKAARSGYAGFTSRQCNWPTRRYTDACGPDGKPWVVHDGFSNKRHIEDIDMLILTIDGLEVLSLAFWYSQEAKYAESALGLLRTYFLDPSTGLKPNLDYSEAVPGYREGSPSGMEVGNYRWNTRLLDSVELLRTSPAWTATDAARWGAWLRAWLEYLHTSDFARTEEKKETNNHCTWILVHKLAVAYALGNSSVGLQTLRGVRSGIAGSLVNQITRDGAMPQELKRTLGATYTRMNLKGLFYLGVVAQRCCAAWGCNPSLAWDWAWEAPRPSSPGAWVVTQGKVSECRHVSNIRLPRSVEVCRAGCKREGSNTFAARWRADGVLGDCNCRRCPAVTTGMLVDQPSNGYTYDAHVFEAPPKEGTGSVRKALDFVLPYARGQKRFNLGNTRGHDASKPWKDLAPVLRLAAWAYSSRRYEEVIPELVVERGEDFAQTWSRDFFNLLWPPLGALGGSTTSASQPTSTTALRTASTSSSSGPTTTTVLPSTSPPPGPAPPCPDAPKLKERASHLARELGAIAQELEGLAK